ncbi:voltage-gated potassium channel [Rhodothalassium salexigens DSM 2132]|uniref:Voltage-gated potassium channel n=1 Tax=Rhodothalassium salexigens DSM 2132 TaxID=1188247 RepID=A0A4R2PKH6_RHOSA|nr:potassium channel family protein [Rhodothalassium salexigens]MBB4211363.1 voltage-gated potassium channel [Rhodothalassium salexigens DSM 2132]MBK1637697.1 ion transporter [Rhodothalassium salexigens DSM 2132]TCP35284.1 voltage-gated potassium channel [Rhodothalassium salexigens DSM 2132]
MTWLHRRLFDLYQGGGRHARRARYAMAVFDALVVLYFLISTALPAGAWLHAADMAIAGLLVLDLLARLIASRDRAAFAANLMTWLDVLVVASLIAPMFLSNLAFVRVVRILRILRSYYVIRELRETSAWFRRHEEVVQSSVNLIVFVFVITALVYVIEVEDNPAISSYLDALYFTVATLTTTGFGDITMADPLGRLVSVLIMVFGVALFLRLVQTIFRPPKIRHACATCGLERHDPDAVHCKHCGATLSIPTEGDWA